MSTPAPTPADETPQEALSRAAARAALDKIGGHISHAEIVAAASGITGVGDSPEHRAFMEVFAREHLKGSSATGITQYGWFLEGCAYAATVSTLPSALSQSDTPAGVPAAPPDVSLSETSAGEIAVSAPNLKGAPPVLTCTACGYVREHECHAGADYVTVKAHPFAPAAPPVERDAEGPVITLADGRTLELREDEAEMLVGDRCACGHLANLHNYHCCTFCMVGECNCAG